MHVEYAAYSPRFLADEYLIEKTVFCELMVSQDEHKGTLNSFNWNTKPMLSPTMEMSNVQFINYYYNF